MKIALMTVKDSNAVQSWATAQKTVPDHAGCYFFSKGVIYPDTYSQASAEAVRQASVDLFLHGHQEGCNDKATWFGNILWFGHKEGYFTQEQMKEVFDAAVLKSSGQFTDDFLSRSGFCDTDAFEEWLAQHQHKETSTIAPVVQWLQHSSNLEGTIGWLSNNLDHDDWGFLWDAWQRNPARWSQDALAKVVATAPEKVAFHLPDEHHAGRQIRARVGMEVLRSWEAWEAWLQRFQGAGLEDEKTLRVFLKTLAKCIASDEDYDTLPSLSQTKAQEMLVLARIFSSDTDGQLQYNHDQGRSLADFLYNLHMATTPLQNHPWLNLWPVLQHEPDMLQFPFMYIMDAVKDETLVSPELLLHGSPPNDLPRYDQMEQHIGQRGHKSRAVGWREELWVKRWQDADVQAYLAEQDPKLVSLAPEWSFQLLAPESVLLENKLGSVQYAEQKKAGTV